MPNVTEDLGTTAAEKIDSTRIPVANALESAAAAVERHSHDAGGRFEDIACRAAEGMGMAAGYVRTHDVQAMLQDAEQTLRRNPVPSLIAAAATGFLLGTLIMRRR